MNRYRYLAKNIGLLTLSNFSTKILSFFLVPVYTNILSTSEYGVFDFFNTTMGILIPILTLNIQEAVLRFLLEDEYTHDSIITIGFKYLFFSNLIVIGGLIINSIFCFNEIIKEYSFFFFFMYFSQAINALLISYIRGIDKIIDLSISSVLSSVITIICNIVFLLYFRWGLKGYFLANIFGPLIQSIYIILTSHIIRKIHLHQGKNYFQETKEMLMYSRPLIANSIAWWINSASDRYVVIFFCGIAENGIYSVASKIPSILNIIQSIFNQAWMLSVVKDFDSEDKNGFFENTYKIYNCIMVITCSFIITIDKILAGLLYAKDFYSAWIYVPWLTIAIVFGALSGYIGGFFSAVKDSKIFAQSTAIGAILNIILNIIFTPLIGPLGAAVATTISYFIVWIIRYYFSKKIISLKINFVKNLITYIVLVIQAFALLFFDSYLLYIIEVLLFFGIIVMYRFEVGQVLKKVIGIRKR